MRRTVGTDGFVRHRIDQRGDGVLVHIFGSYVFATLGRHRYSQIDFVSQSDNVTAIPSLPPPRSTPVTMSSTTASMTSRTNVDASNDASTNASSCQHQCPFLR